MAMFRFLQHIQENVNNDKVAVFLGLEGAFDPIWHQGLIFQLYKDGISGNILKLVYKTLSERK